MHLKQVNKTQPNLILYSKIGQPPLHVNHLAKTFNYHTPGAYPLPGWETHQAQTRYPLKTSTYTSPLHPHKPNAHQSNIRHEKPARQATPIPKTNNSPHIPRNRHRERNAFQRRQTPRSPRSAAQEIPRVPPHEDRCAIRTIGEVDE